MMRRTRALGCWLFVVGLVTTAAACRQAAAEPPRGPERNTDIRIARDSEILNAVVPPRTTLAALLTRHAVIGDEAAALVASVGQHFDLRRVRAGQPYRLDRFLDGRVREFEYEIDKDRRVIVQRGANTDEPSFSAALSPIAKQIDVVTIHGAISRETPSLVQALDAADERALEPDRIELALALADVFSGEVDFNSDLQPGDTFRLVVERATRENGMFGGYGPVMAAELVNESRRLRAVRFTPPDGKPAYYDEQGRSLKRFLLKSPLKFDPRITSHFSRARRHPILNYTRAHLGVDYAAPTGAPVVAVAGGVVTMAGWAGGGGRTVKIRHASGYESEYLHLSAIASGIRRGARVGQGELIGRVGATGLATGPHLHYGLRRNGRHVNPVREHLNMPPGEPIAGIHLAAFNVERDRLFERLTSATRVVND